MDATRYDHFGYVYASNGIAKDRKRVGFRYREQPDNDNDSGWRFLGEGEDQQYTDDPHNIGIYAVTTIIDIDPSIERYLNSSTGCAFERDEERRGFRPVQIAGDQKKLG